VLTIIATVFIPLSFVAGVFGMNFEREGRPWNMPELSLPYGYVLFWGFCTLVAVVMLVLFRRKRWL
jgi:magnesium transporter